MPGKWTRFIRQRMGWRLYAPALLALAAALCIMWVRQRRLDSLLLRTEPAFLLQDRDLVRRLRCHRPASVRTPLRHLSRRAASGRSEARCAGPGEERLALREQSGRRDAVEYLEGLAGQPHDAAAAEWGRSIYYYKGNCYDCHAGNAKARPITGHRL